MKYPILRPSKLREVADQLAQGLEVSVDPHVEWIGSGDEVDLVALEALGTNLADQVRVTEISDKDRFEGRFASALDEAVSLVPIDVLDDSRFWAYLSVTYFWDFIACREEGAFSRGNHLKYVDCESPTESVLTRMYLRSRAVGGPGYGDLADAIPQATDFWRSHVIRVRTGTAPPVTRALAKSHRDDRLATDDLRELARELNRSWTNVVLYLHDEDEAAELIDELRRNLPNT